MRCFAVLFVAVIALPSFAAEKEAKEPAWLAKLRTEKLSDVQRLQVERHDALAETSSLQEKFIAAGSWDTGTLHNILAVKRDWAKSRLDLAPAGERASCLDDIHSQCKGIELILKKRVEVGAELKSRYLEARAGVLEIEILIAKEKEKAAK